MGLHFKFLLPPQGVIRVPHIVKYANDTAVRLATTM